MEDLVEIIKEYLEIFPEENKRQEKILDFLGDGNIERKIDWNNFEGHIVAGGFIYSKKNNKFLCLYHKDLNMYLYPGGHIDNNDNNILDSAVREINEETGLFKLKQIKITDNELVPFDIDTHIIKENKKLKLPSHYHFEFRYLFEVNDESYNVKVDENEINDYKWISIKELALDKNYGKIANKLKNYIENI